MAAGDGVFAPFSDKTFGTHTRQDDFVARFAGDELAILMVGSNPDIANPRIQDLEKATARFPLIWQGSGLQYGPALALPSTPLKAM